MDKTSILNQIYAHKIVAILRLTQAKQVSPTIDALVAGHIKVLEISMNTPDCLHHLSQYHDREDILLGVGTVLDADNALKAIEAGAQFIVTPISKPEIIEVAHQHDKPVLSGAFTPSEILQAYEWGADIIKLFPANFANIAYLKAVQAPLPHIPFLPTGGITSDNALAWLQAGAVALGVGSTLTDKQAIEAGHYRQLIEKAQNFYQTVHPDPEEL